MLIWYRNGLWVKPIPAVNTSYHRTSYFWYCVIRLCDGIHKIKSLSLQFRLFFSRLSCRMCSAFFPSYFHSSDSHRHELINVCLCVCVRCACTFSPFSWFWLSLLYTLCVVSVSKYFQIYTFHRFWPNGHFFAVYNSQCLCGARLLAPRTPHIRSPHCFGSFSTETYLKKWLTYLAFSSALLSYKQLHNNVMLT